MNAIKFLATVAVLSGFFSAPSSALTVNVISHSNFTAAQNQKLSQAVTVLNQILNSAEFKERVLNFSYNGKLGFVQNNGLTNQQIYDQLMAGAEQYPKPTEANEEADMYLSVYYPPWYKPFSSALAFTNPTDAYLHIYNNYYNKASVPDLCNTLVHEWTHKMGFDHDYNSTPQRPYSVPYGIGNLVTELASKYLGSSSLALH